MLDFNSRSALSDRINFLIDQATQYDSQDRRYLGAAVVGHVCERHVQYHLMAARGQVERKRPEPRIMRIFDRGNLYEDRARAWLKLAGFLFGRTKKGKAFADFGGQFKGHVDGVVTGWKPQDIPCPVELPLLWEHKCLGAKSWKKLETDKLKNYSSTYYIQTQIYMHYLGLECCLFMATNADTMAIYHELVPYNDSEAAMAMEKVARVISATDHNELVPRHTQDKAHYICRWCDFSGGCWS
jgi:hypothetical protein